MADTVNVMLDLETASTQHNAAVVQIGAFCFETGQMCRIGVAFEQYTHGPTELRNHFHICTETMAWWDKQLPEIRTAVFSGTRSVEAACYRLGMFFKDFGDAEVNVWANGASFDFPIWHNFRESVGAPQLWNFRKERCYRTLKALLPEIRPAIPNFKAHDALEDAIYQGRHLQQILEHINATRNTTHP